MGIDVLLKIIRDAIKDIPSLKYAFGVLALVSIIAIVSTLKLDYRITVFGVVFIILMSSVILLFSNLSKLAGGHFKLPAISLLWFSLVVAIVLPSLLISSIFFKKPLDLSFYLTQGTSITPHTSIDDSEELTQAQNTVHSLKGNLGKVRFIETWNNNIVAGYSSPNQLVVFENRDLSNLQKISINGAPVDIEIDDRYAYVSTEYPSAVHVIDLLSKTVKNTYELPHDKSLFPELSEIIDGQLPSGISSIALSKDRLWLIASDDSNAVLYSLNINDGKYHIPQYFDDDIAFDARGWKLESISQDVFAITTDTVPSSLIAIKPDGYIQFGGHDYDIVSSATNIWASMSGSVSFIDPSNKIVGINVTGGNIVPVANYGELGSLGSENWVDPIAKVFGNKIYLALNESTIPGQKILWSTILIIEDNAKREVGMIIDSRVLDIDIFKNKIFMVVEDADSNRSLSFIDI